MQQIIYLNEARQHTFTSDKSRLSLNPGRNLVDDEIYRDIAQGLCKSDSFNTLVDNGIIIVQGEKIDITKLSKAKAIDLIELETTIEGVMELLDQERSSAKPRENAIKFAEAKIDAIRQAEEEAQNMKRSQEHIKNDGANDAQ